jgi:hypothetical protein
LNESKPKKHSDKRAVADIQRFGNYFNPSLRDSATVLIGLYGAAAKFPIADMLTVEDYYALLHSHWAEPAADAPSLHCCIVLLQRNVTNTQIGYQLFNSGNF